MIGNNAVKWIECRDSIKIVHLHSEYLSTMDEDELAEISDLYEDIEIEGKVTFTLQDPSINWWIYGRAEETRAEENNKVQFEVSFVQ
jgi:hypothetical protein